MILVFSGSKISSKTITVATFDSTKKVKNTASNIVVRIVFETKKPKKGLKIPKISAIKIIKSNPKIIKIILKIPSGIKICDILLFVAFQLSLMLFESGSSFKIVRGKVRIKR